MIFHVHFEVPNLKKIISLSCHTTHVEECIHCHRKVIGYEKNPFKDCFGIIRDIDARRWMLREHKRRVPVALPVAGVVGTFFKFQVTYTHAPYIVL